jgi:hypothetical protein
VTTVRRTALALATGHLRKAALGAVSLLLAVTFTIGLGTSQAFAYKASCGTAWGTKVCSNIYTYGSLVTSIQVTWNLDSLTTSDVSLNNIWIRNSAGTILAAYPTHSLPGSSGSFIWNNADKAVIPGGNVATQATWDPRIGSNLTSRWYCLL